MEDRHGLTHPHVPYGETMTNLFQTKKVLSVLLLIAIIAAA